jgi:hypothetical protein
LGTGDSNKSDRKCERDTRGRYIANREIVSIAAQANVAADVPVDGFGFACADQDIIPVIAKDGGHEPSSFVYAEWAN